MCFVEVSCTVRRGGALRLSLLFHRFRSVTLRRFGSRRLVGWRDRCWNGSCAGMDLENFEV